MAGQKLRAVAARTRRSRSVTVPVGTGRVVVAAGQRVTLTVPMNAAGRALLRRFARLPVSRRCSSWAGASA
jgi:hypothetical protein